ncbi:polysaccharide lyase 8 family protein [Pseudarthrobacter sp. J64]|uniref:polysaccharide lyase 8 family protein n=1 Tax=Pseudarthrobacter sp. J64 TaxID=3116485 RepID=UPI002E81346B|nr:polysaccharide lyase 8 family protein [Pseudarthrobacter sp. J64]MEE2568023.1 polysaccharide lyase 8 family protein [Pseudarthrobacter sp. J64]
MTNSNSTSVAGSIANRTLSRRSLLLFGAGASAAVALAGQPFWAPPAMAADEFDGLRQRWADYITGGSALDTAHPTIASQLRTMSEDAARFWDSSVKNPAVDGYIWSDYPMSKSDAANTSNTYSRILTIAKAWATVGTDQFGNAEIAATLVLWYRRMYTDWYSVNPPRRTGNWWFWEIGIPRTLADLSILIDSLLTAEDRKTATDAIRVQVANPNIRRDIPWLSETGGNRADKALACILRGIVARNADDIALGRDALSDIQGGGKASLFQYVTSGNGFYADGSYVDHDKLPYVGTYGNVAIGGVARSLMLVAGSSWDVTDPNKAVILDAATKSFAPFIFSGRMMATVRGRAVSRQREQDYHNAWSTANSLMLMATQIAEPYRSTYKSMAKTWLTSCNVDYTKSASLSDLSRALPMLADSSIPVQRELPGHLQFGAQERMVHRSDSNGATWAYTVSTSSRRIGRYEWGNNENNLGWHHGDGVGYLHLASDQGQFSEGFWPTVDPYRMPGTTASLTPRPNGAASGTGIPPASNLWGGGVGLAGKWGTAGMDLTNSLGNVSAKKSWFLLDEVVIALGSGVNVTGADAETIVENRSFPAGSSPALTVDGTKVTSTAAGLTPSYAHLEGIAGYIFLGSQAVRADVAERTGNWREINSGSDTGGTTDPVTRTYATLSVQHPVGTTGGKYGYVIVPGASAERTRDLAAELEIEILRQDDAAHIVRVKQLGRWFVFAHFFTAVADGPVRSDAPCAVLASGTDVDAKVAVSSPTKSIAAARIELELDRPFRKVTASDPRLQVKGGGVVTINATLSGGAGASFEAALKVV